MSADRTLAGRYRLLSHLARGGMADVFEAEDLSLQRRVAVKVLHPQFAVDDGFVNRFRREAQSAANLNHPNIVRIYDSGVQGETHFIVMELIEGRTVRELVKANGPLLPRRAAEIAAEIASALEVAHGAGVIHRDMKLSNVMLGTDGSVRVTDFGISRAIDTSEDLTKTGAVIGTATYFSPEQAQGMPADERSDIYSLGVVLYEMLTGIPPFAGESPVAVAYQHVSEYAQPPSALNPDVPPELDAVVMQAMEKDPAARYQSAAEMRADLFRVLRGEAPAATPPGQPPAADVDPAPDANAATRVMTTLPPATAPPDEAARHVATALEPDTSSRTSLAVLGIVGGVLAAALIIFLISQIFSGGESPSEVVIPNVAGMPSEEARAVLQDLDLRPSTVLRASADVPADIVIETDPAIGTSVPADSAVRLIVSSGPDAVELRNLVGLTEEDARDAVEDDGLVVGTVTCEPDDTVEQDVVISHNPPAGPVPPDTQVDLVTSCGPNAISSPDLEGLTQANARFQLETLGIVDPDFTVLTEEESSLDIPEGFVTRTEPPAGELLPRGGTITLFISSGPAQVVVPDLTGRTVTQARSLLQGLGLVLEVTPDPVEVAPGSGLENVIAVQDPPPNVEIAEGESVVVSLGQVPTNAVPNVLGNTTVEAQLAIEGAGFVYVESGQVPVEAARVGTIINQSPTAGTQLRLGQQVSVVVGVPIATTTSSTTSSTTTSSTSSTTTTVAP